MSTRSLDAGTATWQECQTYLDLYPFAILPLGATEQHGPHLPQNTDTILAGELANAVAKKSRGLVLPAIPIGYSWVWRDFPGSLTFSFDTFRSVLRDIAGNMDRHGCKALMFLSAHGANPAPIKYSIRELADEMDMKLLNVFYPDLAEIMWDADSVAWKPMNFHAEEFETSLMLHLRPELVRMDRAVSEYPAHSREYDISNLPMGALSESGVFGDATVASADKGQRWFDACVDRIADIWSKALEQD